MEPNPTPSDPSAVSVASHRPRLHPLVVAAALSIIALSAVGITTLLYSRSSANEASQNAAVIQSPTPPPQTADAGSQPLTPAGGGAPDAEAGQAPQGVLLSDGSIVAPIDESASGAAAPEQPGAQAPAAPSGSAGCAQCATVVALHELKAEGEGTGLGAVGGGVVGGVVGNSVGSGHGRDLMTILGAVGGAFAGNAIEKNARAKVDYELVVRYENGRTRHFRRLQPWPYSVGEPVRIVKGQVLPAHG